MKKTIPIIAAKDGSYKVEALRLFSSKKEEAYLRKAEAVYRSPQEIEKYMFLNYGIYSILNYGTYSEDEPVLKSGELLWNISPFIITPSAFLHYYNLSKDLEMKKSYQESKKLRYYRTNLKYWSSIKQYEKYERSGKTFDNVYVADMNMSWSDYCGGRCGHSFTRNKIVVLDKKGKVLEMFLDAQTNYTYWIS